MIGSAAAFGMAELLRYCLKVFGGMLSGLYQTAFEARLSLDPTKL